jgi:hypothetical protein
VLHDLEHEGALYFALIRASPAKRTASVSTGARKKYNNKP